MTDTGRADLARPMQRPTAQVEAYVKAMGPDLAVSFLLHFGGADLFIPKRPNAATAYVPLIGIEAARALGERADTLQKRVPLAKDWLVAMLDWQGCTVAEIARELRISDVSVRAKLKTWREREARQSTTPRPQPTRARP